MTAHLEQLAAELEASPDYRVLRRHAPRLTFQPAVGPHKVGAIIDVETTGLDPAKDQIIELGIISFRFGEQGDIFDIVDVFSGFRDPGIPIPAEITALTGITDAMWPATGSTRPP
jgi:DNA polymerase-3 subunit epsilon